MVFTPSGKTKKLHQAKLLTFVNYVTISCMSCASQNK